jgi:polyisoprenoid-binding protein YceI
MNSLLDHRFGDTLAGRWQLDPQRSSVSFRTGHFWGLIKVKGHFDHYQGQLDLSAEPAIELRIDAATVQTGNRKRDQHLRSADFFDAEQNPVIEFRSTAIRPLDEDTFEIDGDITIHGVTRPLTLKATLEGTETDPQGNDRVGVSAVAQIDRSDFGMRFNAALGSGNVVVSDKVKILLDLSAVKV